MKITGIEIKRYRIPLDPPFCPGWDHSPRRRFGITLTYVHTDAGITGIGSGDEMLGFEQIGGPELFIGRYPFEIERHHRILEGLQFHYSRYWPLEVALWDLMGKAAGQPVYRLLGGRTNRLLAYASTGELRSPEQRAEDALALMEQGFRAMKIRFHYSRPHPHVRVVEAVRRAVGDRMDLMVDANQAWRMPGEEAEGWDLQTAVSIGQALEGLGLYWLEEPRPANDYAGLRHLRDHLRVRIAGGEMNRGLHEFRELVQAGAYDVYQPDCVLTGGILGCRNTAAMVHAHGAVYSPHTWSNGIGLLANLHLACAVSTVPYVEFPYDPPTWTPERRDFVLTEPIRVGRDGCVTLPDTPGLGIELDPGALARYEVQ